MGSLLKNRKGQTSVEYLLLLAVAFLGSYLVITGPIANFTTGMINQIKTVTESISRTGEMSPKANPHDPSRLKAVHL